MSSQNERYAAHVRFVVDDRPFCVWDDDLAKKNLSFIRGLKPDYFSYLAESIRTDLSDEEHGGYHVLAAIALRSVYVHALESAFATTFAMMQAPQCIFGWLAKYEISNVSTLIGKVQSGGEIRNRLGLKQCTWRGIVEKALARLPESIVNSEQQVVLKETVVSGFSSALQRMADDYLEESTSTEYNAIKHGFRISPGGFAFGVQLESSPGNPDEAQPMTVLANSKFGSSGYTLHKIAGSKLHYSVELQTRNWEPGILPQKLAVVSAWMSNVQAMLIYALGGETAKAQFKFFSRAEEYRAPWNVSSQFPRLNMKTCQIDSTPAITADQILATYRD